jgi:hypothetical protein
VETAAKAGNCCSASFLAEHLPRRYGVTKGEVVTKSGDQSHSADVIVYDAMNCPVLYSGATTVLPIEGVYGIIEVKSTMSKVEFGDASKKIEAFKRLAPRDLSVIQTREYVTVHRPSRPFGIAFGYSLSDNSLESLRSNFDERHREIHDVNYFVNLLVACTRHRDCLRVHRRGNSDHQQHADGYLL